MQNVLKVRKNIFDKMLEYGDNRKNWEMLCCSDKPLVPFIGAGISKWCYPLWKDLLVGIVREVYSDKCAEFVEEAWECTQNPKVKHEEEFLWTEEIAECIFCEDKESYRKNVEKFSLIEKEDNRSLADRILQNLRDYVGEESPSKKRDAEKVLYKRFDYALLKESGKVPEYQKYFPILFPDILITTNYDNALSCSYSSILSYSYMDLGKRISDTDKNESGELKDSGADTNNNENENGELKDSEADANNNENGELKDSEADANNNENGEVKASGIDANNAKSWLYRAVMGKLRYRRNRILGKGTSYFDVTVPDMPMLLKVHGSIERANDLALAKSGYDKAYNSEIPDLMAEILEQSTLIFMGYGLARDRIMRLLEKQKEQNKKMRHFAFLPKEQEKEKEDLSNKYGVYVIYYDQDDIKELFPNDAERSGIYHDYFLGLLLENLARRIKKYPQPLELLWEKDRFKKEEESFVEIVYTGTDEQFVRRKEALQIWKVLDLSEECPLVAVIGRPGSGKSTLCRSLSKLQRGYNNAMQFFYISIANCKSWDEFCSRIYQKLNIVELGIPNIRKWRKFARKVNDRCVIYWRSVLVLDYLDDLKMRHGNQELWDVIKRVLKYWKEHSIRVVFTCREYPEGLPCYTWQLGKLGKEEATKVFFNACISVQGRAVTYLERKVVGELFARQEFWPSSISLLGRYASSKSDFTSLLEEWAFYYKMGDKGEQTVARILWNHLLDEHRYEDLPEEEKENVRKNILWVWGILGTYPGFFPSVFFETLYKCEEKNPGILSDHQQRKLTEKTLMSMKNIGLCAEEENEKQNILLENIVDCVQYNFIEKADSILDNREDSYTKRFQEEVDKIREDENRSGCFRGYLMRDWENSLRECILDEISEPGQTENVGVKDVLDILKILGKEVSNSEGRLENKELNLVLHYEIKTVISFLLMCHSKKDEEKKDEEKMIEVGYLFSHYYHYTPNYAYPVVKLLLQMLRKQDASKNIHKFAQMNRVMGDIQRLMGRKKKATDSYHRAIKFCHQQILEVVDTDFDDSENFREKKMYEESLRIKADVLLIRNYMSNIDETDNSDLDKSIEIYESLGDDDGKAYYNQRVGELYYLKADDCDNFREEVCEKIKGYYDNAAKLYEELGDKTGNAYIQKCQGDLVVARIRKNFDAALFKEAVGYYFKAFMCYYKNINWRGFSNVMQAMGTCLKLYQGNGENHESIIALYDFAEECYRWLGDVRGLSDTLDYAGHELSDDGEEKHKYMAISKWMESRKLWQRQGNKVKEKEAENNISKLWESLL